MLRLRRSALLYHKPLLYVPVFVHLPLSVLSHVISIPSGEAETCFHSLMFLPFPCRPSKSAVTLFVSGLFHQCDHRRRCINSQLPLPSLFCHRFLRHYLTSGSLIPFFQHCILSFCLMYSILTILPRYLQFCQYITIYLTPDIPTAQQKRLFVLVFKFHDFT